MGLWRGVEVAGATGRSDRQAMGLLRRVEVAGVEGRGDWITADGEREA